MRVVLEAWSTAGSVVAAVRADCVCMCLLQQLPVGLALLGDSGCWQAAAPHSICTQAGRACDVLFTLVTAAVLGNLLMLRQQGQCKSLADGLPHSRSMTVAVTQRLF
jgi:hypothetical protein